MYVRISFIYLFTTCDCVGTRWQQSLKHITFARTEKQFLRVQVWRATFEACSGNFEVSGTIPAFALVHRETKKNRCQDGRSQDLPDTEF